MTDRPADPEILIVGGFLTAPVNYEPMRRRLARRTTGRVAIAPLWPMDWLAAGFVGFGPMFRRTGRAIARLHRTSRSERPVMVVAHSAGGLLARLALSPAPFQGMVTAVQPAVGALITLGTPHGIGTLRLRSKHAGYQAARFLDRVTPDAFFAPATGYVTVGSSLFVGRRPVPQYPIGRHPFGRLVQFGADHLVGTVVIDPQAPLVEGMLAGDGLVPCQAVHLAGARQLTFPDVRHGYLGHPWYGDDQIIDRWWPVALDAWREALDAREAALDMREVARAERSGVLLRAQDQSVTSTSRPRGRDR